MKLTFKPINTIRCALVKVENRIPPEKKKGVVYEIPCGECEQVYVGETNRTMKKCISKHKQAIKRGSGNNGIAEHIKQKRYTINWDEARIMTTEMGYWKEESRKLSGSTDIQIP